MNKEELEKVEQLIEQKDSEQLKDLLAGTFLLDLLLMVEPSPHKENRQTTKRRFH